MTHAVAVILKGYPRLSETFIAQEIRALERRGLALRIVSLRHPTDASVHPMHADIRAPLLYLPEYLHHEPRRVARARTVARRLPGYRAARRAWLTDLKRDPSINRLRRFGQAMVLASELPADVAHVHAHFMHTPASVARYASIMRALPWSFSAHAKDIWTTPCWEKREKLASAGWAVTCTRFNQAHLAALAPAPERVELVYHGLDLDRFPARGVPASERDGSAIENPVRILSVGRLVEKKGFDDLLRALARLPAALNWRFEHVGAGPWRRRLERLARSLGVHERIHWWGALPHAAVLDRYREAELFALASRVARGGDRDGLPNVLMEAQCMGLACVATCVSGIPELVQDGSTGLLVAERDIDGFASALEQLIREPRERARLGERGRLRVRSAFSFEEGIARLLSKFERPGATCSPGGENPRSAPVGSVRHSICTAGDRGSHAP